MKRTKLFFLFAALLSAGLLFPACSDDDSDDDHDHDHDHDNEVVIKFLSPTDEETVADASNVTITVKFEATDENHNITVKLHPEGEPDNVIPPFPYDEHNHDQVIEKTWTVDLSSFPDGTEFHLEAEACLDHDCEEEVEDDIHFSI